MPEPFSTEKFLDNAIYCQANDLRRLQYKTRGFSFLPEQPSNSALSGKHVSRLRGRGLNFEELRHYRPGDDIRSMDWKVTQRTGKPHIKVFTEERERNVYLAIDQRMSMFFGSQNKMKSVIAAELSALLAWRVTETGDRIGAVIFNDDEFSIIPAKRGKNHVINLINAIIKKNHQLTSKKQQVEDNSISFNNMLAKLRMVVGHNALVMLVSDGLGWTDKSTEQIKRIRQHNEVIAYHVFDPLEHKLPEMSQMVVSDGRWQIQFSSKKASTQKKYQAEIQDQLQAYATTAKKYRIPFLAINTLLPVDEQVRKVLGGK